MKENFLQNQKPGSKWLWVFVVVCLALGAFFRFFNLEHKAYWSDEIFTSLRASGYTIAEFYREFYDKGIVKVGQLQKYQRPNPQKSVMDTVKSLAYEEAQHTPLYFVTARLWMNYFSNSVSARRSLSVFFSILAFFCLYWLSRELFKTQFVAWAALGLMAVSPFYVEYAQQARPYSLGILMILLSSAALLRALRLNTHTAWGLYAAAAILAFYTMQLSILAWITHGIYVAATENFRLTKKLKNYFRVFCLCLLSFMPWMLVFINNSEQALATLAWTTHKRTFSFLLKYWLLNLQRLFLSAEGILQFKSLAWFVITAMLLLMAGYALYLLIRNTSKKTWLFIVTMIVIPSLALILPDLIWGGKRSTVAKYMMPCWLAIYLAVAYLFTVKISSSPVFKYQRRLWGFFAIVLILGGVFSCAIDFQAEVWQDAHASTIKHILRIAPIINRASCPLLISDTGIGGILLLTYQLDAKAHLQLVMKSKISRLPVGFSEIFLYKASKELRDRFEKNYNLKAVDASEDVWLWRVETK